MGNEVLFVKYAGNQPVKIETHYIGQQDRGTPLSYVADVIVAVKQALAHRLHSTPVDELTLHAVVDGVEGSALEPDLLVSDITAGRTAKSALIIKSHNPLVIKSPNDVEVDGSHVFALTQRRINDRFIFDNNIDLRKAEDLVKYLDYNISAKAPFNPDKPYGSDFCDNCLEFRLDRRQTTYSLDDFNNIKLLISVSGSGKTRQLLELLFSQLGYYFVSDFQLEDFGSADLAECFVYSAYNPEKVGYFIELLYFVRGFICSFLFDLGYNTPAQILLAQLHPKSFFGCDLFKELYVSLARRTGMQVGITGANIKHWFDFVAIDEIQRTLEGEHLFRLSGSKNRRPFFSPLVSYTKRIGRFNKFVVSGTGINFQYLNELLLSGTMKADQATAYDVISDLKPLDKGQAESYIRQMLSDHKIHDDQIQEVIDSVCPNPVFLGRGRFIAFMVDSVLRGVTVHLAISNFVGALSQPKNALFPLRYYVNDIQDGKNGFDKVGGEETFSQIVRRGFIQYLMKGEVTLHVKGQLASDTVRYGLGFCNVRGGLIQSIELNELAIIECLRYLIPVSDLVPDICLQLASFSKPQMVDYVLEYLVGYALVAGLDINNAKMLKSSHRDFTSYIQSDYENEVLFPDHCCGPDVVYKYKGTVYIVQVKFADKVSKQDRLNACHTTDPNCFYRNKKSGLVLEGFHQKRQSILTELSKTTYKRLVFLHNTTKTTAWMDGVEIINQDLRPEFFDQVNPNLWDMLNKLRDDFKQ